MLSLLSWRFLVRALAHFSIGEKQVRIHVITQAGLLSFVMRVHKKTRLQLVVLLGNGALRLDFLDFECEQVREVALFRLRIFLGLPQQIGALRALEFVHRVPLVEDHLRVSGVADLALLRHCLVSLISLFHENAGLRLQLLFLTENLVLENLVEFVDKKNVEFFVVQENR